MSTLYVVVDRYGRCMSDYFYEAAEAYSCKGAATDYVIAVDNGGRRRLNEDEERELNALIRKTA